MHERRAFPFEVRADTGGRLAGRAVVYGSVSSDLGGFREVFEVGSLRDTVKMDDVRAFWAHDPSQVLGRTKNGTLRLHEDNRGVSFELTPPDTSWGRDAVASIKRGDVDQMSFGFTIESRDDETWENRDGGVLRRVLRARLFEISPVAFPAYESTQVSSRAIEMARRAAGAGVVARTGGGLSTVRANMGGCRQGYAYRKRQIEIARMRAR